MKPKRNHIGDLFHKPPKQAIEIAIMWCKEHNGKGLHEICQLPNNNNYTTHE